MEQDARIEAENNFRSEQQLAKDRRIREQKAYRDFLFVQMNERKARENHKVPFIYYVSTGCTITDILNCFMHYPI